MTDWGPFSFAFFDRLALLVPVRRSLMRCMSEDLTYFDTRNHTTMKMIQMIAPPIRKPMSDLHHFVEQIRTQPDARAQQLFVEFRPDAGGREASHHSAVRIQAALFEHEQILQRDH